MVGGLAGHLGDEGTLASAAMQSVARVRWLDTFWEGCCVNTGTVWYGAEPDCAVFGIVRVYAGEAMHPGTAVMARMSYTTAHTTTKRHAHWRYGLFVSEGYENTDFPDSKTQFVNFLDLLRYCAMML